MKTLRIIIVVLIVMTLGAFFWVTAGSDPEILLLDRLQSSDQGVVLMVLIICTLTLLSTLAGLPVFYLAVALGFLLDFAPAFLFALAINLAGVMAAWHMVRHIFTSSFQERYGKKKLIKRINRRIEKHGMWPVVFSRAIYVIPTNIINYSFPLSKITYRKYLVGTMIGLVPECLVNVSTGYLLRHEVMLLNNPEQNLLKIVVIAVSMVVMIGLFLFFRYRRKRNARIRLKEVVPMLDDQ